MTRHPEVPELIEQYMEDAHTPACWVTVRDLRTHFKLDESAGPALSGFLQKIFQGPFFSCRYKVTRIEKFVDTDPPYRIICRYRVEERPSHQHARDRAKQRSTQKIR